MEYKEIWLDVIGYEGLYQVSNLGNVRSIKNKKPRLLKAFVNKNGYKYVGLCKDAIKKDYTNHRLVLLNFLPNKKNKRTVNHINGIKTDNRLCNLEWATDSENGKHAFKIGLKISIKGEKCYSAKLTEKKVMEIKNNYSHLTKKEIGKIYGVARTTISEILRGAKWKHI
jgi:hypothetical protein